MTWRKAKKGVVYIGEYSYSKGVGFLIGQSNKYKFLSFYESPDKAIESLSNDNPDFIIMEVDFLFNDGLGSIGRIRELYSCLPILVLSSNLKKEIIAEAFCLGATGFISKSGSNVAGLIHSLEKLERDGFVVSGDVARGFIELIRDSKLETTLIFNN